MAGAAQIVEGMGADIVDVNMGCPVPKIAKHNAGCSLMREPAHAAAVIAAMAKAVKIPVTVKMRAGWNDAERNAPMLARMVEDAGAAAVTVHGRTAAQSYTGSRTGTWSRSIAETLDDSGVRQRRLRRAGADRRARWRAGVERRARRPRRAAQSRGSSRRPPISPPGGTPRDVTLADRGQFLLDYIELLLTRARARAGGLPARRRRPSSRRRPSGRRGTIAGSINKCARSARGTRRARQRVAPAHGRINHAESHPRLARDHRRILLAPAPRPSDGSSGSETRGLPRSRRRSQSRRDAGRWPAVRAERPRRSRQSSYARRVGPLLALPAAGFLLIVATNQPDVARGRATRAGIDAIDEWMRRHLPLDAIRVCFHDDADLCACRKPKPGLLFVAAVEHEIQLGRSFMIGDRWRDIGAGKAAGCAAILVNRFPEELLVTPDLELTDLPAAAEWILNKTAPGRIVSVPSV